MKKFFFICAAIVTLLIAAYGYYVPKLNLKKCQDYQAKYYRIAVSKGIYPNRQECNSSNLSLKGLLNELEAPYWAKD